MIEWYKAAAVMLCCAGVAWASGVFMGYVLGRMTLSGRDPYGDEERERGER